LSGDNSRPRSPNVFLSEGKLNHVLALYGQAMRIDVSRRAISAGHLSQVAPFEIDEAHEFDVVKRVLG
jgi:hypothetical protein